MKINTGLLSRMAVALFLTAGVTSAQVPTGTQSNAPSSASPDCADLPVLNERLERANKILHDWPNLGRYAEANATLADRKSTRLNSSHSSISYAVFCLKKKNLQESSSRDDIQKKTELGDT